MFGQSHQTKKYVVDKSMSKSANGSILLSSFAMSNSMQDRVAIVFGVANKRSIAWAIAQRLQAAGAKLAITYQNERLEQEAKDLIQSLPGAEAFMCDVS